MQRVTLQPSDCVLGLPELEGSSLIDFWQWAYGDLCDDDIKGIYAEWLVHKLLGVRTNRRISWANSDVITPSGVRIEVKSSAHWQSWKFTNEQGEFEIKKKYAVAPANKIRFSGFITRDSTDSNQSDTPTLKSDLYIFAFQKEEEIEKWNAFDLNQWEFFLVTADELLSHGWKSISLAKLRNDFPVLNAAELSVLGRSAISKVENARKSP